MTFNEDVNVSGVFDKIYLMVTGSEQTGGSILEICYAIGIPIGIIVFYNHFKRRDIKNDPTPIQVEMRTYEKDVDTTFIENCGRKGNSNDVD